MIALSRSSRIVFTLLSLVVAAGPAALTSAPGLARASGTATSAAAPLLPHASALPLHYLNAAAPAAAKAPVKQAVAKAAATRHQGAFVLGYYVQGSGSEQDLSTYHADMTGIAPLWFSLHSDGHVYLRSGVSGLAAVVAQAHALHTKVYPIVTNDGQDAILVNPSRRALAVQNLVATLRSYGVDGVNIDFEGIDGTAAAGLDAFVKQVAADLRPYHLLTTVAVGPRSSSSLPTSDESDAYDYASLGRSADYVVLMTYDEHSGGSGPGAVAGLPWVETVANYAKAQIPAGKIVLGIAGYGYDWGQPGTPTVTARQLLTSPMGGLTWNDTSEEPEIVSSGHDIWFEDSYSADLKFKYVRADGLGGIALWYLGAEDTRFWTVLRQELGTPG